MSVRPGLIPKNSKAVFAQISIVCSVLFSMKCCFIFEPRHENTYLWKYADTEGPDRPAHPRCPLTDSMDTLECIYGEKNARMRLRVCVG